MSVLVRCVGAARTFGTGETATVALAPTDCEVKRGDRIALVGPSGSGKSTLVHLMAGLDTPTVGVVERLDGPTAVVFQGPSLLEPLTVIENTELPLVLAGESDARDRAREALQRLGLEELEDRLPEELSGGQAQRVAVARALASDAALILADEPTGQLDHVAASEVIEALLATERTLVVSTHDPEIAARMGTRWELHSGRLRTC